MDQLTFSWAAPRVSPTLSADAGAGWATSEAGLPSSLRDLLGDCARGGSCSRMSPTFYAQAEDGTLESSSVRWGTGGTSVPGGYWTLNTLESPNDAVDCSLSDILEDHRDVAPAFYLSGKACAGILLRAERRGRRLPEPLRRALGAVATSWTTAKSEGGTSSP